MSCHICASAHPRLSFLCPTCVRNRLYRLRLENTRVLLEKGVVEKQIEVAVCHQFSHKSQVEAGSSRADPETLKCWALQTILSQQAGSVSRSDTLDQQIKTLKEDIQAKKNSIFERKGLLARRRSDAESARYQLGERETAILTGIQNTTKRTEHLWHSLHSKTAEARIFLCREAAHLYGLRQKTTKKADARPNYVLGGISIVDLRDMNGATPAQISTSLSNIAHLLILVSHYLSLRLPAEITLPHRNYPTPTIFAPNASYHSREAPDGSSIPQTSTSSPTTSRMAEVRSQPRPRPLFIDKPLPRLAKEDPGTYAHFIEGAALLAWDVAWLCRTQGINLSSDSWEEVCNIGKGMWQLLVGPPAQPSTLMRAFAGRDTQAKMKTNRDSPQTTIQRPKSFPMLGHYSHGTVHSFLGAAEGSDFVRSWKLPTPTRIVDKLKFNLLGEMTSAEWELLEEKEWDDEHEQPIVPGPLSSTPPGAHVGRDNNLTTDETRRKGSSGWTKLNSR
ncbi:UV radiation resistance protein and autophagy-related subunit 14-domain-containing protein [Penicillium taxi]|uniref:UV radiation resistance protein and autophagy-related subunit 14-domain-containing protein n=1 Tax=Penicillium taxi TaxID=168475 RepID=UPI002545523E|nr:UV radiation resistance protein and autophagy-related subunit 14-domain-containing protein [Penicillium taxi]KAJ5902424.1 UV radiation resistance protein and autophagy-related subunit 14-domain-containing protein [Penicillium taxi]